MEKLLSDKWDNVFLFGMVSDSLLRLRNTVANPTEEQWDEMVFSRKTPLYLVDHKLFDNFNTGVLVVDNKDTNLVFLSKNYLVNMLNKHDLPEVEDVAQQVHLETQKVMKQVKSDHCIKISNEDFVELLKINNLNHIVDLLNLEKNTSKTFSM